MAFIGECLDCLNAEKSNIRGNASRRAADKRVAGVPTTETVLVYSVTADTADVKMFSVLH